MKPLLLVDLTHSADPLRFANFVQPLLKTLPKGTKTISFTKLSHKSLQNISGLVLSGTTLKDNEYQKHAQKFSFLPKTTLPVLGICAGQHVIAQAFGGKIRHQKESEIGMTKITIEQDDPILFDYDSPFSAYELHHASVSLPKHFVRLATSDTCENQIIKHETNPIYGISFHPEVRNEKMLKNFVKIVQEKKMSK